ncbi:MAG: hypothetical protein IJT58_06555 [Synergistaceae bacterium]|nr:hypothetical protein [Synergistaceae bacterium]
MKAFSRRFIIALIFILSAGPAYPERFIPKQPIIRASQLKPGMTGYILTVIKGTKPTRIPVKILSSVPQRPGRGLTSEILIKFLGGYKIAKGMSGSPVYINGRLAGAVRSGWDMSDHTLGMITPIESMCGMFDNNSENLNPKLSLASDLILTGMNKTQAMQKLADSLGLGLVQGVSSGSQGLKIDNSELKPGDSISALLVWGDIELSASGTVTATSTDGRFIAFGHEFLKRGAVCYPAARSFVHQTVDSVNFPFKLTTPTAINGTITQDRESGIGGTFGYFAPSVAGKFVFKDLDADTTQSFNFRVPADDFLTKSLLEGIFTGLAEEAWGRKGQGTMQVITHIDGRSVPYGWARKDIFYESDNIIAKAFAQTIEIINAFMTQPFSETMPVGFTVTVEATQRPKVLMIEDVSVPSHAERGDEIQVIVKLRGWRTEPITRRFIMKIPDDASGVCEVIVRGGSIQPTAQTSVDEGWKSINSLSRMLTEIKALDSSNELIIELNADKLTNALKEAMSSKPQKLLTDEEEEYMSETKARRIKEGNLKIFSSEYFIDGMQKRVISITE